MDIMISLWNVLNFCMFSCLVVGSFFAMQNLNNIGASI